MACVAILVVLLISIACVWDSAIGGVALLRSRWCGLGIYDGAVGGCGS